ncbi:hypothetical protein [Alkalibacillus salilacus]|uniref:DNA replication protein DnaD n=1 Tax=Alkalibacillus salilacus TaxID=284582 RepID=A0ABT9VD33_9BACI|nr:hypothetical protein [Alkalibacillus salilacus]MDQ0158838.1 hypothetical protein [Alkalibacillus salilacus]
MNGWIKLHRRILEHDIWNDPTTFRLFTLLILNAAHKDGFKVKHIELKRGQYLRSYSKLQEDLEYKEGRGYKKVAKSTIKRSVRKLFDLGILDFHETELGTLFTILNYEKYQGFSENSNDNLEQNYAPSRNEPETNPEREQELKNLRINNAAGDARTREENPNVDAGAPKTEEIASTSKALVDRYLQLKSTLHPKPKDMQAAYEIEQENIPADMAVKYLEQCFDEFEPKYPGDQINSLGYCKGFILERYYTQKQNDNKVTQISQAQDKQSDQKQYNYGF